MESVPYSSGTRRPRLKAPAGAVDCHMHIYDRRFAPSPHWNQVPPEAPVAVYRKLQARLGTSRAVVVQPSTYGIDNACTLDALSQLGGFARGVAVIEPGIDDAALESMNAQGVRGVRVNFVTPQSWGVTTAARLRATANRVAPYGWHVQVFMTADQIIQMIEVLQGLPVSLVIDHLGRMPQPAGTAHSAYGAVCGLLERGRAFVKLSGAYMGTQVGAPTYGDNSSVARGYVKAAPERVIWGSDWPHPTETEKPDDADLLDLILDWAPDDATRRAILVENPEHLYGFPTSGASKP
jgi:predicted TIM-barrel fold metal-dependent hydrolase